MFSTGKGGSNKRIVEQCRTSDVVHLHWICKGFVPTKTLSDFHAPIVWSLRDMWPLTGGCHYTGGCEKFATECGPCPVLGSRRRDDLAQRVFREKRRAYRRVDLTFIALNQWMADVAQSSALGQGHAVRIIPNAIERSVFAPCEGSEARRALGIRPDMTVIAFSAMGGTKDPRKGFDILRAAMPELVQMQHGRDLGLLIIGEEKSEKALDGIPVFWAGHVEGESNIAQLLNAADVFVAPSRQDNLPNAVAEALACGLPSIAFDVGGIPDLIQHKRNGYLANPFSVEDFAQGIHWTLTDSGRLVKLKQAARDSTARLDPTVVAAQHIALYEELLSRRKYSVAT
jgi:glycosyltransferase involved in cell wall biosynthesis